MDDAIIEQRFNTIEDLSRCNEIEINDLKTITMGPPPQRNNGLRGDLNKLRNEFETSRSEAINIKVANINLRGVYIMGALQFAGMIIVALIAAGVFK